MFSYIPDRDSAGKVIQNNNPFASKEIDGKKLFKRVHGVVKDCVVGDNEFILIVPYVQVKLDEIRILWAPEECTANFYIDDSTDGLYQQSQGVPAGSVTPNLMLNQFGFTIGVEEKSSIHGSKYDADVFGGMRLRCNITVPVAKKLCVNFIMHELK